MAKRAQFFGAPVFILGLETFDFGTMNKRSGAPGVHLILLMRLNLIININESLPLMSTTN